MNADTPPPIAVAVSGGADSLYTLIRLQESGMPVVAVHGIFAQYLSLNPATAKAEAAEASAAQERLANACAALHVPLHILDLSDPFMERVIRPFVESYAAGLTPNPCALCNAGIKFGLLLDGARALEARRIATGHYVRMVRPGDAFEGSSGTHNEAVKENAHGRILGPQAEGPPLDTHLPALLQGADPAKDQSYFLALVPLERLAYAEFPLGGTQKSVVREALVRRGIAIPQPKESQNVCFIPGDEYRDFVFHMAERLGIPLPGPGPMLLADGTRLGTHKGLWQYTEGQRYGLGIGWKVPLRVLAKEREDNILRLGPREDLWTDSCLCGDVNILLPQELWPETVFAKTRYREPPRRVHAAIAEDGGKTTLHIHFLSRETAVAPGQVAAIYVPVPGCCEADGRPVLRLAAGGIIR